MNVSFFVNNSSKAGVPVFDALIDFVKTQHQVTYNDINADVAVIWSVLWNGKMAPNKSIWNEFKRQGKPIIVLEVGGLKRNVTWKVGIDGINARANFANNTDLDVTRPKQLGIELKPWNTSGENIIICGQHQKSEQWINLPHIDHYYENRILEIKRFTDAPIFLRDHPRHQRSIHYSQEIDLEKKYKVKYMSANHVKGTYDSFDFNEALKNAKLVVSESSNPAMEATINGVPAWTGPDSLTYPVSVHPQNLNKPLPDREEWLVKLCHTEWTIEEISKGIPWTRLKSSLQEYRPSN
jgi:hypothetical protein